MVSSGGKCETPVWFTVVVVATARVCCISSSSITTRLLLIRCPKYGASLPPRSSQIQQLSTSLCTSERFKLGLKEGSRVESVSFYASNGFKGDRHLECAFCINVTISNLVLQIDEKLQPPPHAISRITRILHDAISVHLIGGPPALSSLNLLKLGLLDDGLARARALGRVP